MWVRNCLFGVVYFDLGDGEGVHDLTFCFSDQRECTYQ